MSVESVRELASETLRRWPRLRLAARRLDRRLSAPLASLSRERLEQQAPLRGVNRALSGKTFVDARFAGVLDGRTFNIDLLARQFAADDVVSAELHVVRGPVRRTAHARLRPEPDGRCAVEATVLLDDSPGGLDLRPGAPWFVEAVFHTRSRGRRVLKVLSGPQIVGTNGITRMSTPHPDTGLRYRVRPLWSGRLAILVEPATPVAELSGIELDWLRAALEIRAVGWELADESAVEIVGRSGTRHITLTAERVSSDRIRCDLPVNRLAALAGGPRETVLNVFLRSDGRRLRVGRVLNDVVNPKRVLKPTPAVIWAAPGVSLKIRAVFTPAGSITLACRTLGQPRSNGGA